MIIFCFDQLEVRCSSTMKCWSHLRLKIEQVKRVYFLFSFNVKLQEKQ